MSTTEWEIDVGIGILLRPAGPSVLEFFQGGFRAQAVDETIVTGVIVAGDYMALEAAVGRHVSIAIANGIRNDD